MLYMLLFNKPNARDVNEDKTQVWIYFINQTIVNKHCQ